MGPTYTRPTADSADSKANWVAENDLLHRVINRATNAAVPIPPHRFSKKTAVAME